MLNRTPPTKNTSEVLSSYRKRRQQRGPFLIYGAAALLLIVGIFIVIRVTSSGNSPLSAIFATDTPTATLTFTPTVTITPSVTPTDTVTPTITITPTPGGTQSYTIQQGDLLPAIAEKFNLGPDGVALIYEYNPDILKNGGTYQAGQTINIPAAGTIRSTSTPLPAGRQTINYVVISGDTLGGIISRFNSTQDELVKLNPDIAANPNALQVGTVLKIPINVVTATATLPSTSTPVTPTIAGQPTQAPAATAGSASSGACTPTENAGYITDLEKLINDARTSNSLPALNVNEKLATAAKAHAVDMVCNNYLGHNGLDGSTPETRVKAQGYTASLVKENLYALYPVYGLTPKTAFDWWMQDSTSHDNILNANVTEFGIAYVEYDQSLLGGYFVVVFAKP